MTQGVGSMCFARGNFRRQIGGQLAKLSNTRYGGHCSRSLLRVARQGPLSEMRGPEKVVPAFPQEPCVRFWIPIGTELTIRDWSRAAIRLFRSERISRWWTTTGGGHESGLIPPVMGFVEQDQGQFLLD